MASDDYKILEEMNEGEKQLYNAALKFESENFKLIPNVLFDRHDQGTNQIDLIAITKKGIFVIEMKDYKGWIFGHENHLKWTQVLHAGYGDSKKYKLRNPIKQNDNHIKTVKNILSESQFNDIPIYNVIVFGSNAVLKDITSTVDVVNLTDIGSVFNKYRDIVITNEEIISLYNFLEDKNIKDLEKRENHLNYIDGIISDKDSIKKANDIKKSKTHNNQKEVKKKINVLNGKSLVDKNKSLKIFVMLFLVVSILKFGWVLTLFLGLAVLAIKLKVKNLPQVLAALLILYFVVNPSGGNETIQNSNLDDTASLNNTTIESSSQEGTLKTLENSPDNSIVSQSEDQNLTNKENSNHETEALQPQEKNIINNESKYIKIGMKEKEIEDILGPPDKILHENRRWNYNRDYVTFDEKGLLNGWNNQHGALNPGMEPSKENAEFIDIGSTKNEVLEALGSPSKINSYNHNEWYYSLDRVIFNNEELVTGWINQNGKLNSGMKSREEDGEPMVIGSRKEDVLKVLGSPTKIYPNDVDKWYYKLCFVNFDNEGLVNGWKNQSGGLDYAMKSSQENADFIDIGSTKDQVLEALGSPTKINPTNQNEWFYSLDRVIFNNEGLVVGWINQSGHLNQGMEEAQKTFELIDIGSSKEDVIKALGSPTKIFPNNVDKWYYGLANINFNKEGLVNGWKNYNDVLTDKVVE